MKHIYPIPAQHVNEIETFLQTLSIKNQIRTMELITTVLSKLTTNADGKFIFMSSTFIRSCTGQQWAKYIFPEFKKLDIFVINDSYKVTAGKRGYSKSYSIKDYKNLSLIEIDDLGETLKFNKEQTEYQKFNRLFIDSLTEEVKEDIKEEPTNVISINDIFTRYEQSKANIEIKSEDEDEDGFLSLTTNIEADIILTRKQA